MDPRKYSHSSSAERFLEHSHSSLDRAFGLSELDCGRSCDYKVGSPSYLDKIAWREGKPQHYSEPKLILDLSNWKRNSLPRPVEGNMEDLPTEAPGDLFLEISRWVESTQSRLHSPSPPPEPLPSPRSPPLPLSPTAFPGPLSLSPPPVLLPAPDLTDDESRTSPPPSSSPLSLLPPSPSSPLPALSPAVPPVPAASSPPPSEAVPPTELESQFDLDVLISRALKLGGSMDGARLADINGIPRIPDHCPSRGPPKSAPEMVQAQGCHKEHW